jgi:hypothetical protein
MEEEDKELQDYISIFKRNQNRMYLIGLGLFLLTLATNLMLDRASL